MCGRFQVAFDPRLVVDDMADVQDVHGHVPARYNVAPGQMVLTLQGGDCPTLTPMRWGLVPHWVKEAKPKIQPINARVETADQKPYFSDSLASRRCVIPASGFYEWLRTDAGKTPYLIHWHDRAPLWMAGVWDTWHTPDGALLTFAILTTRSNELMAQIHDRMPVLLPREQVVAWLSGRDLDIKTPIHRGYLRATAIGTEINNARNEGAQFVVSRPGPGPEIR
mgnify:CR=1 FL=1